MTSTLESAVTRLSRAADTRSPCAPVRDLLGTHDLDGAYAVQSAMTARRLARGDRIIGYKIGLTSPAVQNQFGVTQPDFGTVFANDCYGSGEAVSLTSLIQPRVEAEVALVLAHDVHQPDASVVDVLRAVDFALAAIEVVDSRITGWDIAITDTIADNASAGAIVLGTVPVPLQRLDLAAVGMVIEAGGEEVSTGVGAACMGSPLIAATWLVRELSRRGHTLRAGDVILSGALGPMVTVDGPGRYAARIDGIGEVEAVFTR